MEPPLALGTIRAATDVGGTFTDLVYFSTDPSTGVQEIVTAKSDTTPPDFERGVLNVMAKGGVSSHAALVARQMGKVCICGASAVLIDYNAKTVTVAGQTFKEGDYLSIDGTSGVVFGGQLKTSPSEIVGNSIGSAPAASTPRFTASTSSGK